MLETLKIALSKPLVLHRKANGVGEGAGLARVQRGHGTCDPVHTVTRFLALLPEGQVASSAGLQVAGGPGGVGKLSARDGTRRRPGGLSFKAGTGGMKPARPQGAAEMG